MRTLLTTIIVALSVAGCAQWQPDVTAVEPVPKTLCELWGEALPTRSRSDTEQTQTEITELYADFTLSCPENAHLVPH